MIASNVAHDEENNCFRLVIDNAEAILNYQLLPPSLDGSANIIDFTRTYVPPEFRGKGFAEALVRAGLNWAQHQGHTITASCWYVQKFI